MKKMAPKKKPMKAMTPAMASRVRKAAKMAMGVRPDRDSAAGAAT